MDRWSSGLAIVRERKRQEESSGWLLGRGPKGRKRCTRIGVKENTAASPRLVFLNFQVLKENIKRGKEKRRLERFLKPSSNNFK
jgi:hypothetical protein